MPIFVDNIEELTLGNTNFRKVLSTNEHSQLVVMSLKPMEDIGMEVHDNVDQFFRIDAGEGKVIANGQEFNITDGYAVVIPAGTEHNVINTSETERYVEIANTSQSNGELKFTHKDPN